MCIFVYVYIDLFFKKRKEKVVIKVSKLKQTVYFIQK